jgi:hypothetical protein
LNAALKPHASERTLVVDWVTLLDQLRQSGARTTQISQMSGIPRTTLFSYRDGTSSPSHAKGEVLISLWIGITRRPREQLPMTNPAASAALFHD